MAFKVLPDFTGVKIEDTQATTEKLPDFTGMKLSDFEEGTQPVKVQSQSIINDNNQIVNTEVTYGKKVNFMTDTQVNKIPREQYFGMAKIAQDYVNIDDNKLYQELRRGAIGTAISMFQSAKRFTKKIKEGYKVRAELAVKGIKGEERKQVLTEWSNEIATELQQTKKINQQYLEGLGFAKTEEDGLAYDAGGAIFQLGASFALKSAKLVGGLYGVITQQNISEEVFANLGDSQKAELVATAAAIPIAIMESFGFDILKKTMGGNKIISSIAKSAVTESIQEGAQAITEEAVVQTFGGREKEFKQTVEDTAYNMLLGFISGSSVATVAGIGSSALQEQGMQQEQADNISNSLATKLHNNEELKSEVKTIIRDQNDNTTNYGNNVDNGIAEVNKAIQVERSKIAESEKAQQEQQKVREEFLKVQEEAIDVNSQDFLNSLQDDAVYLQTVDKLVDQARGTNKELSQEDLIQISDEFDRISAEKVQKPKTLIQFINESGGIIDEQGELVGRELAKQYPFVIRKEDGGKTIDEVGRKLFEAGYFKERPTETEVLNAIDDELRGNKRYSTQEIESELATQEQKDLINKFETSGIDFQKVKDLQKVIDFKSTLKPITITDENGIPSPMGEVLKQVRGIKQDRGIDAKVENNFLKQEEIRNTKFLNRTAKNLAGVSQNVGDAFNSVIQPVSSLIEKISPKLWIKVEKYLYKTDIHAQKSADKIKPFNDKMRKLDSKKFNEMDFYMKNITIKEGVIGFKYKERLDILLKETGMTQEFKETRNELNRIYKELKDVGVDVGFLENYIPRMVDPKKREAFLSYLKGSEQYSPLIFALEQEKFYNDMSLEERAKFVNNYLRGFIPKDILTLGRIGNLKFQRTIQEIDGDLNQFYLKTSDALIKYVESTTKLIEQKKLFGTENQDMATLRTAIKRKRTQLDSNIKKNAGKEKIAKVESELKTLEEQVELMSSGSLQDSVGQIVYDLASKEALTSREEQLIKRSLSAIIDAKATPKGVQFIKNLQYALTLGNVKTTISQIGDLGLSIYKNNYIPAIKATISKKEIDVRDLGINSIMEELSTRDGMSKFIEKELKWTGLHKLDILMKNVDANSNLINTRNLLKKGDKKINEELDFIFDEYAGQSEQVKKDILNGINSEDVGYYIYSKLSQTQPINVASMPLSYLENPNTRYMYSLKTFAIKQLDFARKQIFSKMRKEPVQAFKNLIKLQTALMLMGATKDVIKSMWDDEELDVNEVLLNNIIIYNLIGRYNVEQAFYRGTGSAALNLVTPPLVGIVDKVQKGKFLDVVPFGKDIKAIKEKVD